MIQGALTLAKKDLKVFAIIEKYREGIFSRAEAALKLGLSVETISRRTKAIREKGIEGLIHGNRGKSPAIKKHDATKSWYIQIYKDFYFDFNFSHAFEFINKRHNVPEKICYDTFRSWLKAAGFGKVRKKRPSKARMQRERHANRGLMIQFDGSPHKYNNRDEWTLIHAIDDASSELLGAQFHPSETTVACMKVIRSVIEKYGVPEFILTDCAGWSARTGKRSHFSQFERACNELGITVISTPSPQSKGRVERSFRTAQDRLIPELRLNNIQDIDLANRYISQIFVPDWNKKFSVQPAIETSRFRPISPAVNLDDIFCFKTTRMVNRDHTVNYDGKRYKLLEPPRNLWKHTVEIFQYEDGTIKIMLGAEKLAFGEIMETKRSWLKGA